MLQRLFQSSGPAGTPLMSMPRNRTTNADLQDLLRRRAEQEPLLKGQRVAFTGVLASMTHREAFRLVERHGGEPVVHVSRSVTMLVVGEEGWPLDEGRTAVKFRDACRLIAEGTPIRILNEAQWLQILGMTERRADRATLYTPAMLSQLLGVSPQVIRRWTRIGLLQPVRRVFRLPYFDLGQVSRVQRLCELLQSGMTPAQIESALQRLADVLGPPERVLAELDLLRYGSRVLLRDEHSLIDPRSGQRLFDFEASARAGNTAATANADVLPEPPASETPQAGPGKAAGRAESAAATPANSFSRTAEPAFTPLRRTPRPPVSRDADELQQAAEYTFDDWFDLGCELLESAEPDAVRRAVECFRMCLMDRPFDAETQFLLAESLFRADNPLAAIERYHCAIECDHEYLEAWIQLGCVYASLERYEEALAAFDTALDIHPESPEAALHKGLLLCELKRPEDAAPLLELYLRSVPHGPWAEHARDLLRSAGRDAAAEVAETARGH
ncbi:MAG: tetratricopeptide repeat protein [Planctomycetota bacterium]|nr:MAG: tetratricopeptide repeat protein [Planctomycetota bacterium]